MAGIIKYIRVNLLGIAAAIGVCSFLYEALILQTSDFALTKSAAILIFIIATSLKFKDNRERRNQLENSRANKDHFDNINTP